MNWLVCFSAGFLVMSGALVGLLSDHPFIATAVGAIVVGTVAGALAPHVGALLSWVAWRLPPVPWRVRKARRLGLRPVAVRRLDLALGLVLLTGTAHAQMTLGIDTRGVDAVAAQAATVNPAAATSQTLDSQPAAQAQQGKMVKMKEINEVTEAEAKKIYQQRMGAIVARENEVRNVLRWLVDPILGKWNLHLYYGSLFPTGGQCSGETGPGPCKDGFEYKERRRGEMQRLGVQLTINPIYNYGIGFWRIGVYVGGNFGLGWVPTGLASPHLLEFGGFMHFAFLGVLNVRVGGGGMLEQWGTKSNEPGVTGLIQRSVVPGHGDFSVGTQIGRMGLSLGCRVRQDAYLNLDGTSGGSWGIQCGPEMHGVIWGHFKPGEQQPQ